MEYENNTITPEAVEDLPGFDENEVQEAQEPTETDEGATEGTEADTEAGEPEKGPEKADYNPYAFNPLQMALRPLCARAIAEDALFAEEVREKESRSEKPKSLAECAEYIMGEAYKYASEHKQGNFGLAACEDDFIVGLIKHYYDEDDIKINKVGNARASVKVAKEKPKKEPKKEPKPKKPERPKETLDCTNVPMVRPESKREAKRESKKQADNIVVMDMFAGMWE